MTGSESKQKSPARWPIAEQTLTENLTDELNEAWLKVRAFASDLGSQQIYASGKAIVFSVQSSYFFVRPKKSYLEIVVFLSSPKKRDGFKSVQKVSKIKFAHSYKMVHADQLEGSLAEAIRDAFRIQNSPSPPQSKRTSRG